MTRKDTGIIMDILAAAYPRFYAGNVDMRNAINLWAEMFAHDDVALVAAAVKSVIESDEKGFPPTIGQVKAKMRLLTYGNELTEADVWGMVAKALRNGIYGSAEEFAKFPPTVKRIVGSAEQLREWATMDSETVHSVVASNFQRSYRAISAREREIAKLPADVKALLPDVAKPMDPPKLPKYVSQEETLKRLEAERRAGWDAARQEDADRAARNKEIISKLRGEEK